MSKEIPSFTLSPDQRASQTISIICAPGSLEAHFETGVRSETQLSQTNSTTYNSIFSVFVSPSLILSHRRAPKAPKLAEFEVPRREASPINVPVSFLRPLRKLVDSRRFASAASAAGTTGHVANVPLYSISRA
jgi:hypothetical protein